MSDEAQKLRLRPRSPDSDPVTPASLEPNLGAEASSLSDQTPGAGAGSPHDVADLAPRIESPAGSAPPRLIPGSNPTPIGAPPTPSIQGAQRAVLVLGIAVIVIFLAAGFLAYRLFVGSSEPAEPGNILAAPATIEDSRRPPLNTTLGEPSGLPRSSGVPAIPPTAPVALDSASDSPADGSTENVASAFRTWVDNVKISGVRVSSNPRILIGKVSFNQGDVVDEKLGIIFVGYDKERYVVRFQDSSGAILERHDRVLVPINAPPMSAPRQPNR